MASEIFAICLHFILRIVGCELLVQAYFLEMKIQPIYRFKE